MGWIEQRRDRPGKPQPWRVRWRDNGREYSRTFPTRRAAKTFLAALEPQLERRGRHEKENSNDPTD